MESKLKKLFDYQKFENNGNLGKVIDESLCYVSEPVMDENLAYVYGGYNVGEIKNNIHQGTNLRVRVWNSQTNKYDEFDCVAKGEPISDGINTKVQVIINGIPEYVDLTNVELR